MPPDIEAALVPWRQQLASLTGKVVGSAALPLHIYRDREATLGRSAGEGVAGAGRAGVSMAGLAGVLMAGAGVP